MSPQDQPEAASEAALITIYYWQRGFMLLAPSFVLEREHNPYRRLSATLLFSRREPFMLDTKEGGLMTGRAMLVAPKVSRRRLVAVDSDLVICDLAVVTPEYDALSALVTDTAVRPLDDSLLAPLLPDFERASRGELAPEDLRLLLRQTTIRLSGREPRPPRLHARVSQALTLIEAHLLHEITPQWLADQVHLSASRMRQLFSEQLGCSLTHYLRWNAVWKAVWLWSRGQPLAQIVDAVGFYDLAHLNRAFNEVFGLNPSALFRPSQIRLIRCDWD